MPVDASLSDASDPFAGIQASEVHHLPIVQAYADRLGPRALINRPCPSEREFEPGLTAMVMIVDTLSGQSPLYHLESFFECQDTEVLRGERVEASLFNDDNAGATLDLLDETGIQIHRVVHQWQHRSPRIGEGVEVRRSPQVVGRKGYVVEPGKPRQVFHRGERLIKNG